MVVPNLKFLGVKIPEISLQKNWFFPYIMISNNYDITQRP